MATKKSKEPKKEEDVPPEEKNEQPIEDEEPPIEDDENQEEGEEVTVKPDEIFKIDPYKLRPHIINKKIYGDKIDEDLVASIIAVGQLEPVVIGPKHVILSGHRRWIAKCAIKDRAATPEEAELVKITCVYKEITDPILQKEALLEYNRQRKKNLIQIYHEAKVLKEIYAEKAKYRMHSGKDPGPNSEQGIENEKGRTGEKIAAYTGIGKTQLNTLFKIGDRYYNPEKKYQAKSFKKNITEVMKELKAGVLTISAAENRLNVLDSSVDENLTVKERNIAKSLVDEMKRGNISPNKAGDVLEEFRKKAKEPKIPKTKKVQTLPDDVGNVFVVDPQSVTDLIRSKKEQGTLPTKNLAVQAPDAAIFIWADKDHIDYMLGAFDFWGFHKKAIAVWHSKTGGTWFNGDVEFLLFGIKGDMVKPAEMFPIVFECEKEKRVEFVYEMAEKMFPDGHYCTPFSQPKREGWLEPVVDEVVDEDDIENIFDGI